MGMGGIMKECPNCDGIGHIKVETINTDDIKSEQNNERKRGRPKKTEG